jgi:hypothetical protein
MTKKKHLKTFPVIVLLICFSTAIFAQAGDQTDSREETKKEKKDKKRKDEFKVFAGINFNNLNVSENQFRSETNLGYLLGASYKRGKFFYWEIGARYNVPSYDLTTLADTNSSFQVNRIDVPITAGINFLSFMSRIAGLRVYISAIPAFNLGVSGNELEISKDDINSFIFFGQAGIGVDVAFIFVEAGWNYGFGDLFQEDIQSNPSQVFVNLGFRF